MYGQRIDGPTQCPGAISNLTNKYFKVYPAGIQALYFGGSVLAHTTHFFKFAAGYVTYRLRIVGCNF